MDYQLLQLLESDDLRRVQSITADQLFADGAATASGVARAVKNNLQETRQGPSLTERDQLILGALGNNDTFQKFAIPHHLTLPTFARYTPGMQYGAHVDGALMGAAAEQVIRTDFAMTLFLSAPSEYEGGELILETGFGEQEIKLQAGEAVLYPATTIHRVAPVTSGERLVAVFWVQSAVPDPRLRAILFDLSRLLDRSEARKSQPPEGEHSDTLLLSKTYQNLLRYAVQT